MAGLYIHIPFCKQPCSYCNFFFSTSGNLAQQTTAAMIKEMEFFAPSWDMEFTSLYFGGGTPSHLPEPLLKELFKSFHENFRLQPNAEVTLEANPDDLTPQRLEALRALGINRLSLGVQSFHDEDLQLMNRAHSSEMATKAIQWAREAGFEKISIDLIYGIPGGSLERWSKQLEQFFALEVEHLSSYALTVEEGTRLYHDIRKGKIQAPSESEMADQFALMSERLQKEGYRHYEVSNLALPGCEAVHNSSYWSGKPYLGIGPSAHSFDTKKRWWNIASLMPYIQQLEHGTPNPDSEIIDVSTRYNEYIMTGLRTTKGIHPETILKEFGEAIHAHFLREVKMAGQLCEEQDGRIALNPADFLFADRIASDLMIA